MGFPALNFVPPPDERTLPRIRAAELSRSIALREDFDRLQAAEEKILRARKAREITPGAFARGQLPSSAVQPTITQDLLHQATYDYAPGVDKQGLPVSVFDKDAVERAATQIESVFGTLEDQPGWSNPEEYAEAGRRFAQENASRYGSTEEAYRASKQLLSPQRYKYMQDVGRTVDLLRSLKEDWPVSAWQHYSRSQGLPLARRDSFYGGDWSGINEAGYQRFEGQGPQEFFEDPVGAVAWYLRVGQSMPNAIKSSSESGFWGGIADSANNRDLSHRFRLGPVEVLDIPSLPENATPEQVAAHRDAYMKRRQEVYDMAALVRPPSWHETLNRIPFLPNFTAGQADTLGVFGDAIDPTLVSSLSVGVPARMAASQPARILSGLTARKGAGYAASMLARHRAGGLKALEPAERAVFRALNRSVPRRLAGSMASQGVAEGLGELPFASAGAAMTAMNGRDRTWGEYWGQPAEADLDPYTLLMGMENDENGAVAAEVVGKAMSEGVGALTPFEATVLQGLRASEEEARKRAHVQFEALQNTAPQDIWSARSRHEPRSPYVPQGVGGP